jgi:peptidoglycan/xylan/chitin deacetylase (PgdA/CDA1 family)
MRPAALLPFLALALTAPASADPAPDSVFYSGGLRNGWLDWSWVTHKITQPEISHSGTAAASIDFSKSGGFYLHHPAIQAPANSVLSFFLDGGSIGGQQFTVRAIVGEKPTAAQPSLPITDFIPGGKIPANTWIQVQVPLAKLGVEGTPDLTGFWLQDSKYTPQPTLFIDDISLQPAGTPLAAPAPAKPAPVWTAPAAPPMPTEANPRDLAKLTQRTKPAYIILKIDDLDLWGGKIAPGWQKVVDYMKERNLKCNIGIICKSLETTDPTYIQWIKDQHAGGLVEFWNHGYTHREWKEGDVTYEEFKGRSYEEQKQHLLDANRLAKEKLGFPLTTFSAPFNAVDENTIKALADDPDTKIWMYGDLAHPAGKIVLDRVDAANLEQPTFQPNFARFVAGYAANPSRDYFVIQAIRGVGPPRKSGSSSL